MRWKQNVINLYTYSMFIVDSKQDEEQDKREQFRPTEILVCAICSVITIQLIILDWGLWSELDELSQSTANKYNSKITTYMRMKNNIGICGLVLFVWLDYNNS